VEESLAKTLVEAVSQSLLDTLVERKVHLRQGNAGMPRLVHIVDIAMKFAYVP
jgi:hypothetical protein